MIQFVNTLVKSSKLQNPPKMQITNQITNLFLVNLLPNICAKNSASNSTMNSWTKSESEKNITRF